MAVPGSYNLICPMCDRETTHKILKGEFRTSKDEVMVDGVVKCKECGHTRKKIIREKTAIDVPLIISWKKDTSKTRVTLLPEEWIHLDDELLVDGSRTKITAIETRERRVSSAQAQDIVTIWTKRFDRAVVKVAVHKGRNTISHHMEVPPEEEFYVNDPIQVGRYNAVIYRIKTTKGVLKRGSARAEDITRIFARMIG